MLGHALAAATLDVYGELGLSAVATTVATAGFGAEGVNVLASGGRDLTAAQSALAGGDDLVANLPGAHAEITALDGAAEAGLSPERMAVSRLICPTCQAAISDSGGVLNNNLLGAVWK